MKKPLLIIGGVLVIAAIAIKVLVYQIQGPAIQQGETDLRFEEVTIEFTHSGDAERSLPFMGLSTLDVDGDRIDELFVGGGWGTPDALFRFDGKGFIAITKPGGFTKESEDATFGAASIDTNGDGLDDLFVARESGVTYYVNQGDGTFSGSPIAFDLAENTVPLSVALGDINRDGWVDLYISGYIKIELAEGETNFDETYGGYSNLLLNNGDNTWKDITQSAGVHRQHNTFLAMFIDLDNNGWCDLVVAQDTGKAEIWSNNGDLTFTREANPTAYSYPMGIGAGDIDNDGLVDLYMSNVGYTLPKAMLRGNLAEDKEFNMSYMLLRNKGAFAFEDVSDARNAARYGFGWGTNIVDFNNDGRMDLYFAQNYARFPGVKLLDLYPGRLLQQGAEGSFQAVEGVAGLSNKNFGITQVISDFNQDGWPDIVLANLDGPLRAFLNKGGSRHHLTVHLPTDPAWLNTRVTVTTADGTRRTRQYFASEGLCSDSTDAIFFGLGDLEGPLQVRVQRPAGEPIDFEDVPMDSILKVQD